LSGAYGHLAATSADALRLLGLTAGAAEAVLDDVQSARYFTECEALLAASSRAEAKDSAARFLGTRTQIEDQIAAALHELAGAFPTTAPKRRTRRAARTPRRAA
jgi:tRNA C32,U32 (ribose-2'-O)-methylase TrmJ